MKKLGSLYTRVLWGTCLAGMLSSCANMSDELNFQTPESVTCFGDLRLQNVTTANVEACTNFIVAENARRKKENNNKVDTVKEVQDKVQKMTVKKAKQAVDLAERYIEWIRIDDGQMDYQVTSDSHGVFIKYDHIDGLPAPKKFSSSELILLLQALALIRNPHDYIDTVYNKDTILGLNSVDKHTPVTSKFYDGNIPGNAWSFLKEKGKYLSKRDCDANAMKCPNLDAGLIGELPIGKKEKKGAKKNGAKFNSAILGLVDGRVSQASVLLCNNYFSRLLSIPNDVKSLLAMLAPNQVPAEYNISSEQMRQSAILQLALPNLEPREVINWDKIHEENDPKTALIAQIIKRAHVPKLAATIIHEARHGIGMVHAQCKLSIKELIDTMKKNSQGLQLFTDLISLMSSVGKYSCDEEFSPAYATVVSKMGFENQEEAATRNALNGAYGMPGPYSISTTYPFFILSNLPKTGFMVERILLFEEIYGRSSQFNNFDKLKPNLDMKNLMSHLLCYSGLGMLASSFSLNYVSPANCDHKLVQDYFLYSDDYKQQGKAFHPNNITPP